MSNTIINCPRTTTTTRYLYGTYEVVEKEFNKAAIGPEDVVTTTKPTGLNNRNTTKSTDIHEGNEHSLPMILNLVIPAIGLTGIDDFNLTFHDDAP